jgi:transposase
LTVIAALGLRRFYFRFVPGPIKQADLVQFLQALQRTIRDKLFILWDGLPQHRSRYVAAYLQSTASDVVVEYLPGYAPELNPTEYIWSYMKQHELGNLCGHTLAEVKAYARRRLQSMQRRAALIASFWKQSRLEM